MKKWDSLKQDINDLDKLAASIEEDQVKKNYQELKKEFKEAKLEIYLSGKYDDKNTILTLQSGAGGIDAEDWTKMLARMYKRYAEKKDWKITKIAASYGDEGGLKSATYKIKGNKAYGWLKEEQGVHRLIRISPYSSQDLRHTSFALVEVMPELDLPDFELDSSDLKINTYRASGPGGQHVNRRETAVRITHLPTGLQAASQNERSQARNREEATKILKAKLATYKEKLEKKKKDALKTEIQPEWGNQIRTYVLHPYKQVRDHRTEIKINDVDTVLDGNLDPFIKEEIKL